jgi:putative membrane protein
MQDKQFDWYTPQKLSPYAFLFIIGKVINQSWAFLLIFIGGKFLRKEKGIGHLGMGYFILIIIGFIAVASIPYIIQYLRFRIFVKGNDLIVLKGLFTKKVITIPIHKIQSVNAVQGYLNRFTETCELKIETAGDEGTEVEIKAIDEKKA